MLWNDPATGVMRHADAGYEEAIDWAKQQGLKLPSSVETAERIELVSDELPVPRREANRGQAYPSRFPRSSTAIMMVLALIGDGVTLANVTWAENYWRRSSELRLICIAAARSQTRHSTGRDGRCSICSRYARTISGNFSILPVERQSKHRSRPD